MASQLFLPMKNGNYPYPYSLYSDTELLEQDHKNPMKVCLDSTNPTLSLSSILAGTINGFIPVDGTSPVEDLVQYALF